MGLFDMFKKKDKVVKGNDNMEHIWNLTDTNDFVVAMTEHLDNKTQYGEDMSALSEAERIFYITQTLEMEVNSGGFSQFFYNSSGNFSNELVGAFTAIGANATAAICQKAISAFGRDIPVDRDEREESDSHCQKFGLLSPSKSLSVQTQLGKLPSKGMMWPLSL